MLRLATFGGLTLWSDEKELPQPRRRIAVLARVAASHDRGVSRDELLALFWPERDLESARHSLDQLFYETRRAFGVSPIVGIATLRLDLDVIACDVVDWNKAQDRDDLATAAPIYRGPFLQGFHLNGALEFERWMETTRSQLAADYRRVLETLATRARAAGNFADAVTWWRRLALEDRLGSRTALGLMRALVDAGDRAGALEFARVHERIVRAELEAAPDPIVAGYADSLRAATRGSNGAKASPAADTVVQSIAPLNDAHQATTPATSRPRSAWRARRPRIFVAGALLLIAASYGVRALGANHATLGSRSAPAPKPTRSIAPKSRHTRHTATATSNIAAYEMYERGREPTLQRSEAGVRAAIDYLLQAVALDSNYAAAYATLGARYANAAAFSRIPLEERRTLLARADSAARRAVALDDSLADAHTQLGFVLSIEFDPMSGVTQLERAVQLDPGASEAYEILAKAYELVERPADALAAAQRGVNADSLSAGAAAELADALYFAGRDNEALAQLAKVTAVQPPLRRTPAYIAEANAAIGRWSDAIAVLQPIELREPSVRGLLGFALARSGARADAQRLLNQMLADEASGMAPASGIAEVYVGLGDYDRAFVWLDRAFDDHSLNPRIMGPLFRDFRADARFERVRQRLGTRRSAH